MGQRRVRCDARPHRPAVRPGHQRVFVGSSPRGMAGAASGVWVAARAIRGGQPPRRHPDRRERPICLSVTRRWHTTSSDSGTRHRLRRSGRFAPVRWRGGAHARPRPGHDAAAPGRRRHDVHVHAPPGNPLLQRHARAGVRLPPRHPAPAQLRRLSRLLRRHPRRVSVPPAPAAVRPVRRDRHRRRGGHGHLPPGPRRPRLPLQARAASSPPRPRPARPTTPSTARRSCPAPAPT